MIDHSAWQKGMNLADASEAVDSGIKGSRCWLPCPGDRRNCALCEAARDQVGTEWQTWSWKGKQSPSPSIKISANRPPRDLHAVVVSRCPAADHVRNPVAHRGLPKEATV